MKIEVINPELVLKEIISFLRDKKMILKKKAKDPHFVNATFEGVESRFCQLLRHRGEYF